MTKTALLFATLLGLAACQSGSDFNSFNNEMPVDQIAEPTDGVARGNDDV